MFKKLLLIIFIFILRIIALSDIQILQEVQVEDLDPKSGIRSIKKTEQIKWIIGDRIVTINGDVITIVNLFKNKKKNNIIIIDNKKKEFFKISFPIIFSNLLPKELTAIRINKLPKLKVKELNLMEKIGKYNCKTYKITLNFMMMMIKIKIWSSEEIFNDSYLTENSSLSMLNSSSLINNFYPNLPEVEKKNRRSFYNVLKKIKGIQIKSVVEMDLLIRKLIITTVLKKISYKKAPADIFVIPKSYKERVSFQK